MIPLRPVYARAVLTAYIVASVPELVKRTRSKPKRLQILVAASVEIGEGVTNSVPISSEV